MEAGCGGEEEYLCTEGAALVPANGSDLVSGEVGDDVSVEVFEV